MKQHIEPSQLNELSDKGKEKLREADMKFGWDAKGSYLPLLSIGQLIEFLNEHTKYEFHIMKRLVDWKIVYEERHYGKIIGEELADSLWEACKEVLNG